MNSLNSNRMSREGVLLTPSVGGMDLFGNSSMSKVQNCPGK